MARVNILKQIKSGDRWKLVSIPRDSDGKPQWKSLPEGRYYIEWHEHGKRKREAAGATVADAQEAARRRKHVLEHRALGFRGFAPEDEALEKTPLHIAVRRYLDVCQGRSKSRPLGRRETRPVPMGLRVWFEGFAGAAERRPAAPGGRRV